MKYVHFILNLPAVLSSVGSDGVHFLSSSVSLTLDSDSENILRILRGQFASQNIGMVAKQT
jgi:hypothetical protein